MLAFKRAGQCRNVFLILADHTVSMCLLGDCGERDLLTQKLYLQVPLLWEVNL